MSPFQLIVTGVFVAFIILGVGVFALFGGLGGAGGVGTVVVWGTVPAEQMDPLLLNLRAQDKTLQDVTYIEKSAESYEEDLVSAMAAGTGPDLFFIEHENLFSFGDKILKIPYSYLSARAFSSSFVDEGQLFLTSDGALALPLLIDPLVMYWNRDLFASQGVSAAPRYWNDFLTIAPKITSHDTTSKVTRSAVALGEWRNIGNAKAILSALMMQAGDPIVLRTTEGWQSALGSIPEGALESPGASALRFYTEFGNPSKAVYSWNRSLPEAQDAFVAGDLGVYFGFASEEPRLRERNPNLQLGVEVLPQIEGNSILLTYGKLLGAAVSRSARNPQGAAAVALTLTGREFSTALSIVRGLPSVRRDVSPDTSGSASATVFAQSALIARGWLDPQVDESSAIFGAMIESVSSGRSTPAEAINDAGRLLDQLIRSKPTL